MTNEQRRFRAKHLQDARQDRERLRTTLTPEMYVLSIEKHLVQIKAGYEELDLFGTRSAMQVEDELRKLVVDAHVRAACQHYGILHTSATPEIFVLGIVAKLNAGNAPYKVLDATKNTAEILNHMLRWGGERLDPFLATKLKSDQSDATRLIAAQAAWETGKRRPNQGDVTAPQRRSASHKRTDAAFQRLKVKIVKKGRAAQL